MAYDVEGTEQFEDWYMGLDEHDVRDVTAAIDELVDQGPALGRPRVDKVAGSKHHNMKELRIGSIRIFFIFDPTRTAILLVAGDKRGQWQQFYLDMLPVADALY